MEKKTKKRGAKIAAALVALTALTSCVVGTTFAKYTSSTEAKGTVLVAHWEVVGISANTEKINEFTFETGKDTLSPALPASATETAGQKNEIEFKSVTVTNNSDVAAQITWALKEDYTVTAETTLKYDGATLTYTAGEGFKKDTTVVLSDQQIKDRIVFSVSAQKGSETAVTDGATGIKLEKSESLTITVTATWTTKNDDGKTNADDIDTLIGMYVASVAQSVTLTATQASTLPTA